VFLSLNEAFNVVVAAVIIIVVVAVIVANSINSRQIEH